MADNIYDQIIEIYNELTKSEIKVASYVLEHKIETQYMTISELARACDVAEATLTRFCKRLNRRGFNDFKLALAHATNATEFYDSSYNPYGDLHAEDSIEDKCQKLYSIGVGALRQTLSNMNAAIIEKAVDILCGAQNVCCFGQGNSNIIAMDAWGRFSGVSSKFRWIPDSHSQAQAASLLGPQDAVLYFSFSGATRELIEIGELTKKYGAKLILITRFPNSPGVAFADVVFICAANETPLQQGSVAAKIAQLYIIDVLFDEFCSKDIQGVNENRTRTMDALISKFL